MAKFTKAEIIEQLEGLDVEVPEGANKEELESLLKSKIDEEEDETEEKDDEEEDEEPPAKLTPKEDKKEVKEEGPEDYLQQYQYGKEMELGSLATNPPVGGRAATMKANLLKQPKVSIFIPRAETEPLTVTLSVCLNRYRLDLPKQVYLELPKQIAEVIMESQNQQAAALKPFLADRDKGTADALNG